MGRRTWATISFPRGEGTKDAQSRRRGVDIKLRSRSRKGLRPGRECPVARKGKAVGREETTGRRSTSGRWTPTGGAPREESEQKDADQTQKKKKKKEKKKAKDIVSGRHAAVAAQKELKEIYSGTGLEPREKVRRRVLARAQKLVSRKKTTSSSSGSSSNSSSSSSPTYEDFKGSESVFSEETKVKGVAERCPGALTVEAVTAMRRSLLTIRGGGGGKLVEASSPSILQERSCEEDFRSTEPGVAQPGSLLGSTTPRSDCSSSRRDRSAVQSSGGGCSGHRRAAASCNMRKEKIIRKPSPGGECRARARAKEMERTRQRVRKGQGKEVIRSPCEWGGPRQEGGEGC